MEPCLVVLLHIYAAVGLHIGCLYTIFTHQTIYEYNEARKRYTHTQKVYKGRINCIAQSMECYKFLLLVCSNFLSPCTLFLFSYVYYNSSIQYTYRWWWWWWHHSDKLLVYSLCLLHRQPGDYRKIDFWSPWHPGVVGGKGIVGLFIVEGVLYKVVCVCVCVDLMFCYIFYCYRVKTF